MLENSEKEFFESIKAIKIPRTFVFDQTIPENEYHLYIDPEEYYNEEFDVCRDEFQNYRTSLQKKQKTMSNFNPKRPKNIRLCLTTQNKRKLWIDGGKNQVMNREIDTLLRKTDAFDIKKEEKMMKNSSLFDKRCEFFGKTSEGFEKKEKLTENNDAKSDKTNQVLDRLLETEQKDKFQDILSIETIKTLPEINRIATLESNFKWNKKEMNLSVEIRDNDKTQIIIEKTKRAIRKNEIECAKLKRRVNDGFFLN